MNESGRAVQSLADYFGVSSENLLIIHDDIDLPLGSLRISFGSSAGGHNGVQSVIDTLGTSEFLRLRAGIKPAGSKRQEGQQLDEEKVDTRDFVLQQFSNEEQKTIEEKLLPELHKATAIWVKQGRGEAMNQINT